jgi:ribose transport system ATP-binding protein
MFMKGVLMGDEENIIEMRNINKHFSGIHALSNVSFSVKKGEIHAVVGQNGAGKSTLMKILSGAYQKDSGDIYVNGLRFQSNSVVESHAAGVGVIYQEFALCPDLTVTENIFINRLVESGWIINWKKLQEKTRQIIHNLGFDIDPCAKVGLLSVAYQQVVEIAKTLSQDVKILVLDEPTAVLSPYETKRLFTLLRDLKDKGTSTIYISHRLPEIFDLSDRITIMKDGSIVKTVKTSDVSMDEVITAMIGKSMNAMFPERNSRIGPEIMTVTNIFNESRVSEVSFTVHEGEILGIAGLVGAGKTELARAIFGADSDVGGKVEVNGRTCNIRHPLHAIVAGIGYLPENRKEHGVILDGTLRVNITMAALKKVANSIGLIDIKKEYKEVTNLVNLLKTKITTIECEVSELSGGNQQKVSLSKWLFAENKVIILDEPTRGVDVNAKSEIYNIINDLSNQGIAFVLISSEIEELLGLCDRIIVLNKGAVAGTVSREEFTTEKILNLSIGR